MKKLLAALITLFSAVAFGATLLPIQLLNPTGSTAGQAIISTGSSTAPAWGGVGLNGIAPVAANTVLANATNASAPPAAFAMPSCSTSSSALGWASGSGVTCNTSINAAALGGATFAAPGPIGSITPNTGAFTSLSASGAVTGPGFGSLFAAPPTIGNATPNTGKFTTLQATSTITPSSTAGIVGTSTNDNAQAGSFGEFPGPVTTSATNLVSNVVTNATSNTLTAGDWDVECIARFNPAGSTVLSFMTVGVSTTSGTLGAFGTYQQIGLAAPAGAGSTIASPVVRISLASSQVVYCIAQSTVTTSTATVDGYLRWRRAR